MDKKWWKESVVYQIYPKSFCDSNGDGIGDLRGIISRLDRLKTLGVDILWLNPIYASPDVDNGYDISDYQAVNPQFGTLADLDCLLEEAHRRGLKVIMDLVINHTSDQHPWFRESRSAKDNPYRDYYIWRDGKGGQEPNNWGAHFTQSAWTFDALTGQYYLNSFSPQQPDLNWESPRLRQALYAMIRWWLKKGIDGFRLDAISFIAKAHGFPDNPGTAPYPFDLRYMMNGPAYHGYLRELNREALRGFDIVTVGECIGLTVESAIEISAPERGELAMPFLFEHTDFTVNHGKDAGKLKEILTRWQTGLHEKGWIGLAFNNHDLPRVVSLFGSEAEHRAASAKLFATLLLTLEGTPFLYQGEEIGMTNAVYDRIEDLNDLSALNLYRTKIAMGVEPQAAFEQARRISRDPGRSPYQWDGSRNAGFTTGTPWLGVNRNYPELNLEKDLADPGSIFHYYQALIALRKKAPALVYGAFEAQPTPDGVFAYRRTLDGESWLVVLNLTDQVAAYRAEGNWIIGNYQNQQADTLQPYEARVYRL